MLAFFRLLRQKKYDQSFGMLTTYLFPHIKGAVYRFLERTLAVQRHDRSIEELAPEEEQISFLERYADGTETPTHIVVYRKICAELLGELFNALPRKDKQILGKSFGAFGFEQTTLDEIALEQVMRVDGVVKARNRALEKLRGMYAGSGLELWRWVWKVVMNVQ
jgi:RNA polymerase primary sigma factor